MIKAIILNLEHRIARDPARDFAITIAETFDTHVVGVAFAYVTSAILSYVADNSGTLIVMGGYGHAKLREVILGGRYPRYAEVDDRSSVHVALIGHRTTGGLAPGANTMRPGLYAFAVAASFLGAAIYVGVVEQPARLALSTRAMLQEWTRSNRRGTLLMSVLAVVSAILATIQFRIDGDVRCTCVFAWALQRPA
jgi:hypothetical protein